ncbi:DUF6350 family protein [Leucobacter allii]|uniref:cell division protein PerM n=1 Tax=Leucobacter allii TaxID=2932247 RepID=UPI001FD61AA2|nr:DUF6350 family protein [Leucobacter allii]UOR02651.1 DUF6350 family protein [Leucobacter allii]
MPLAFSLSAEAMLGWGFAAEALSFTVSLMPLGITLLTAALAGRAGWRFGRRGGTGAAGVLGGAIGFGAVAFAVALLAAPLLGAPAWAATLMPAAAYALVAGAAFVLRAARDAHPWWAASLRALQRGLEWVGVRGVAALPARAAETLRIATAGLAAAVGLAAIATAVACVAGYGEVIALTQSLQLDPLGSVLVFLAQLALLPVAVAWALAWLSGAGFAIGAGSSVSPFETLLGPLPALPLFGAVPDGWGAWGAIAPALLVVAGIGVALLFARRDELRRASWPVALAMPVVAALLAGLGVAGISALASGALGPDRLQSAGASPWLAGGLAAAELGVGLLLGAAAGRADLSRVREALPAALPGTEALQRLAGARARGGTDAEATVDLSDLVGRAETVGRPDPADPRASGRGGDAVAVAVATTEAEPADPDSEPAVGEIAAGEFGAEAFDTETIDTGTIDTSTIDTEAFDTETIGTESIGTEAFDVEAAEAADAETAGTADAEEAETAEILRAYAWDSAVRPEGEAEAPEERRARRGWRFPPRGR